MQDYTKLIEQIKEVSTEYGILALKAIIVLIIGLKVISMIAKLVDRLLTKSDLDNSLRSFLGSLLRIALKAALFVSVIEMVGVKTTSFVAILGAAGLAIGMSLQGALGNLAGGVMILLFRPFKVGDVIEAQGHIGTVKEIQIFCTVLLTPDLKTIILPNSPLSSNSIVNYSKEPIRRVDMVFGIGYGDDIKLAKEVLIALLKSDERVLESPALSVNVGALADSSVNFNVRPYVKSVHYWDVYFDMQEKVKLAFDEKGISIPFPQREMHIINKTDSKSSL
ncbi:mechanosensitive ion channel family protein [Halobacteriovorax sp. HLS]|uniref:mechanosensitive ion channel family protein n=1 Tax=Halobacteriovorax sp. HLS TaxID=2234000 RepID=UPI000FD84A33|nr:mechanosensitive ion channel domain-containing protein [Halobacteriovorax sp. HLS]